MRRALFVSLLVALAASAQFWQETTVQGFTLRWATVAANELSVELSYQTTG